MLGTYIHGILDNQPVIDFLLQDIVPATQPVQAAEQDPYDRLAEHVRAHVDIAQIYSWG